MRIKIISVIILGFIYFFFGQNAHAETFSYSATNFQSTACPTGSEFTTSTLTTQGDLIKIIGTGFGNRDVNDSDIEMVYIPTNNGVLGINRGLGTIDGVNNTPYGILSWSDGEIQLQVDYGLGGTIGAYVILRTYPGTRQDANGSLSQSDCVRGTLNTGLICSSFTYSDWSTCTNSQQTRTIVSSSPNSCTGGNPILTQSCTPLCTANDYSCTDWSVCSIDGQQTRICTETSTCEGGVSMPATSQSCTYAAPTCTSWTYTDWGACSAEGQQTRTIVLSSPEGCSGGSPILTQSCTPAPTCTVDTWTCSEWSACSSDSTQTKTCTLTSDCPGVDTPSPATSQSCTYNGPIITLISPTTIYPGTYVTLNGTKFMNLGSYAYSCTTCKVLINDKEVDGLSWYSWYENKVSFTMPSDAQSGYVQIQDSKGNKSNKFNFTISVDPATVPPVITSFSPKAITPGDTITITGSNFGSSQGSSQLIVGSTSANGKILSWTDTEIKYQTSNYWDNNSQKIGIKKCKSYYDCLPVVYGGYFYIQPKIISIDSNSGPVGSKILISGNYFKDSNVASDNSKKYSLKVYFNGTLVTYLFNWTSTIIELKVPGGATSGNISLEIVADTGEKVSATGPYFEVWQNISNDEFSARQVYFKQINIPSAWSISSNQNSITVAIIDDGIHNSHPDLQSNLWINSGEKPGNGIDDDNNGYIDDYFGWDFVYNTNNVAPNGSHGTSVAGIIGAIADNGKGIAGVNKNVKLMPLLVCDKNGSCLTSAVVKAIKYAVDNGAKVINLSLGSTGVVGYTDDYDEIIKYAYDRNVIIVAAAGNGNIPYADGWDLNIHPESPVCNDNGANMVIGVGAVDDKNFRTKWTNFGSKCVDIYAPGVDILSTSLPSLNDYYNQLTSIDGGGYYSKASGTSFAAPIVTGIVSLLKATFSTITSQEIISLLVNNSNNGVVDAFKVISESKYFTPSNIQIVQAPVFTTNSTQPISATNANINIPINNPTTEQSDVRVSDPKNLDTLLPALGVTRNEVDEAKYFPLVASDANNFKVDLLPEQKTAITNFITYGISWRTISLGMGERRALVRDYFETVGRGEVNWEDMERLVRGQKVVARNLDKENAQVTTVLRVFKKIFGHDPVFSDNTEDLSWNTMMYRIRFSRDLDKEKVGIIKFKQIFKYSPKSPLDWAAVRALGYIVS